MAQMITVEELKEGMVVDSDVMNPQGLVLLKKGVSLQEKHIKTLQRWGVASVSVADVAETEADTRPVEEIINERIETITAEMNERFEKCANSELMMLIKRCVFSFRVEQIKKQYKGN